MTTANSKEVAKIKSTFLGIEDHGICTFMLHLDYGGSGQGAGGLALDEYDDRFKTRLGTADGMQLVMNVIKAVGVQSWEEIPGKTIYALIDHGRVVGIENLPTELGRKLIFDGA